MIEPPRTIERLLAGLGARAEFRDALLGDLAEEYASRAETEGVGPATRWYRREALRAVPHLLRSWLQNLRLADAGHIGGVVATAYTGALILSLTLFGMIFGVVRSFGYQDRLLPWSNVAASMAIFFALMLFAAVFSTLAGYLAAYLDARAPLVSAATLGLFLFLELFVTRLVLSGRATAVSMAGLGIFLNRFPNWYLTSTPALELACAIVGGMLCVRRREHNGSRADRLA